MNPYIYLFKTPLRYYFYEVNNNKIISVTPSIYSYLKGEDKQLEDDEKEYLEQLKDNGYLNEHRVKQIKHCHTDDLEYQIKNREGELLLQITQACNLNCCYCPYADSEHSVHQRNHSSKNMSWEVAKNSLDQFLENSSEITDVTIGFYGGEPFINFPLIKKIVEYVEENYCGKNVQYSLTTNGTLLTDEIISFLRENDFHILFSIDGPESIHDKNRKYFNGKGSFNETFSNLKKTVYAYGKRYKKISINMVINPDCNFDKIEELFNDNLFQSHQIDYSVSMASNDKRDEEFKSKDDFHEKLTYNCFLALLDQLKIVKDVHYSEIAGKFVEKRMRKVESFNNISSELNDISAPTGPCIPGQRRLFVNAFGEYFPCERASELSDLMKIGSVENGVNVDKAADFLNFSKYTEKICTNCWAFRFCGICAAHLGAVNDFSYENKKKICSRAKKSLKNTLEIVTLEKELKAFYGELID